MCRAAFARFGVTRLRPILHALLIGVLAVGCNAEADAAPAPAPRASTRATGPAPQPVRGTLHTVRMLLDNEGFRFEPAYLTVAEGDGIEFRMISGVPHNVAFDDRFIPRASRAQLAANLGAIGARDLAAPVVTALDSTYVVSTSGLPKGEYLFYCGPHRSLNMHGVVTVQ
jgi:plastocyanin